MEPTAADQSKQPSPKKRFSMVNAADIVQLFETLKPFQKRRNLPLKDILYVPTTLEVLGHPKFKTLRIIWMLVLLVLVAIVIKEVAEITTDLLGDKSGTLITHERMPKNFVASKIKTTFCPNYWPNLNYSQSVFNLTEFEHDVLRLYMSQPTNLTRFRPEYGSEWALPKGPRAGGELNFDALQTNGLAQLIENYTRNFYNVPGRLVFTNSPIYVPCFLMDQVINASTNSSTMIEMGSGAGRVKFIKIQFNVYKDGIDPLKNGTKMRLQPHLMFTQFNGQKMTEFLHDVQYQQHRLIVDRYRVHVRHFVHRKSRVGPCIPSGENDFLPVGYGDRLCHRKCNAEFYEKYWNCTYWGLAMPSLKTKDIKFCKELEFHDAFDVDEMLSVIGKEQQECAVKNRCYSKRFCSEWEIFYEPMEGPPERVSSENQVSVVFIVKDIIETHTDYPLRTLSHVISDYGGQMGLWIGASISSVIQLFTYWCWRAHHGKHDKPRKKSRCAKCWKKNAEAKSPFGAIVSEGEVIPLEVQNGPGYPQFRPSAPPVEIAV